LWLSFVVSLLPYTLHSTCSMLNHWPPILCHHFFPWGILNILNVYKSIPLSTLVSWVYQRVEECQRWKGCWETPCPIFLFEK
jgi:hypothetical protein